MPIVWNAEAEARLLAGLFKVCDIKVGKQQLEERAAMIDPECSAKAVSHRIQKFKNMGGKFNGRKKGADAAAGGDSNPATPKKGGKGGKGSAKKRAAQEDDEEDDDEEVAVAKKPKVEADDCDE